MAAAFALGWFALALVALAAVVQGATILAAQRRLDARIARDIAPLAARSAAAEFRLPGFLKARGRDGSEIAKKLRQAGFQAPTAIERFLWIRLGATIFMFALIAIGSRLTTGSFLGHWLVLILATAGTYLIAKRALDFVAASRERRITAEFPFLLDLLLMMLESGISLDQCLRSIAQEDGAAAPRLVATIRLLVADLDRGTGYEAALDRWAERVAIGGAKELAALFEQSLFQGVELSVALKAFNREFTERRVATARESVGRISVQMVLIMVVFFMPAVFIVVGGPPVHALFEIIGSQSANGAAR
jgi:tight adherence protein C